MENLYLYISVTSTKIFNDSMDLWLTFISVIIAILALIISTCYAAKSARQVKRENFQKKKEIIFNVFNDFLLYLETITNADNYGIKNYSPENSEIDFNCLNTIGKIRSFSQIHNLLIDSNKKLNAFIENLLFLSNDLQDARKIRVKEKKSIALKDIANRIRTLREEILEEIKMPKFFKENKN